MCKNNVTYMLCQSQLCFLCICGVFPLTDAPNCSPPSLLERCGSSVSHVLWLIQCFHNSAWGTSWNSWGWTNTFAGGFWTTSQTAHSMWGLGLRVGCGWLQHRRVGHLGPRNCSGSVPFDRLQCGQYIQHSSPEVLWLISQNKLVVDP